MDATIVDPASNPIAVRCAPQSAALPSAPRQTCPPHRQPCHLAAFARFLPRVASGDNADDKRVLPLATWLARRRGTELELASATIDDVEDYW